jgi:small subunit ribosomal protein S1
MKLELPKHKPGDRVIVRVVAVGRHSIRVDLYGIEVIVPKNEIEYGYVANPADHVQIGDKVPAVIRELELMTDPPKIKLSLKDAKPDPFINVPGKYRIGGEYLATVTGMPQYGVFVSLEQGVSALCPYPRWSDFDLEVGDRVLVKIRRINQGERKIDGSLIRLIRKGVLDAPNFIR